MNEQQIILIKRSWRILRQVNPHLLGGVFYDKLFSDQPSLRRLFKTSMDEQSQKLIDMLSAIVVHLDNWEGLQEDVRALAIRHTAYGVKPEHYQAVGTALLWTLKQALGNDWQPDTEEAWQTCYGILSTTMITSSHQAA